MIKEYLKKLLWLFVICFILTLIFSCSKGKRIDEHRMIVRILTKGIDW